MARSKRQKAVEPVSDGNYCEITERELKELRRPNHYARTRMNRADWRSIEDDREKYNAYLCSREWNVLKEAVHKRAKGQCERCRTFPIAAVHHLTYERKYREELEDLQAICKHCHEFTHGKSQVDPSSFRGILKQLARFLFTCKGNGRNPPPFDFIVKHVPLEPNLQDHYKGTRILVAADLEVVAYTLTQFFPFAVPNPHIVEQVTRKDEEVVAFIYRSLGFELNISSEYLAKPDGGVKSC